MSSAQSYRPQTGLGTQQTPLPPAERQSVPFNRVRRDIRRLIGSDSRLIQDSYDNFLLLDEVADGLYNVQAILDKLHQQPRQPCRLNSLTPTARCPAALPRESFLLTRA